MPTDTPWSRLEIGGIDSRRVDAAARWGWFWALLAPDDAALILRLEQTPDSLPDLPRLRNLEIGFQMLPGSSLLCMRLKDPNQRELFETLCHDVIAAGELADTEDEALQRCINRMFRWHYLLRGGRPGVLSLEAQKGLIGEITVLERLIDRLGAKSALAGWTGPSGAPKDFEFERGCIEVKARRGASRPFVRITSEFQLADAPSGKLWLSVVSVDQVQAPLGETLTECVDRVHDILARVRPSVAMTWEQSLADTGYDPFHDYSAWRWFAADPEFHIVTDGFPRIVAPMPLGVSRVSYDLSLAACAPFLTDWLQVGNELSNGAD